MTPLCGISANTALRDAQLLARSLIATADGQRTLLETIRHLQMIDYGFAAVRPSVHTAEQTISTNWLGRSMFRSALRLFAADPSLNRKAFGDPGTTESPCPGQSHNKDRPGHRHLHPAADGGSAVAHARPPKPDGPERLCLNRPCRAPLLTRFRSVMHRPPPEHASTPDKARDNPPDTPQTNIHQNRGNATVSTKPGQRQGVRKRGNLKSRSGGGLCWSPFFSGRDRGQDGQDVMASANGKTVDTPVSRRSLAATVIVQPVSIRSSTSRTGPFTA
jgi:hypothetical protein